MNTDTLDFFAYFLEYILWFMGDNVDEYCKWFSNSQSSASGCRLAFACFFCQFKPSVAYEGVAYKKKRNSLFLKTSIGL